MTEENKYYYSVDESIYNLSFEEACEQVLYDDTNVKIGETKKISRGTIVKTTIGDYFDVDMVLNIICENAMCGGLSEFVDTYPDADYDQEKELERNIKAVLEEWANKHNLQPNFGEMENIEEVTVKLLGDYKYEVVSIKKGEQK